MRQVVGAPKLYNIFYRKATSNYFNLKREVKNMNNQDYKALHYINKILDTGDIYEYGLLSYNRELNILPLTKQENEKDSFIFNVCTDALRRVCLVQQ